MIDKLSLTTFDVPDQSYLMSHGELKEDRHRLQLYKFMYRLDKAVVMVCPHKFSESVNARIAFTKIEINPQRFECYENMMAYVRSMFPGSESTEENFSVNRVDVAVDLEGFPVDSLLAMLRIKKIRSDSLSFFKGTIYAGSDPKIRIYDKVKEIKSKERKGKEISTYEKGLVESGKDYTRFEIQIRGEKKSLQEFKANAFSLAGYFERIEIFEFGDNGSSGVLHFLYKYVNRKYRNDLEKYKNHKLVEGLRQRYQSSVEGWFSGKEPF